MDLKNLEDFRNDPLKISDDEDSDPLEPSAYHQEINTRKIEKLSNRVTIISVIIPCLIFAILVFAYLDMKERVVDADATKTLQVETIARQLEEKLNALDVRIAKNKFDFDQVLPQIAQKEKDLVNQTTKITASKADAKTVNTAIARLDKEMLNSSGQSKSALQALEGIHQELAALKETNAQFQKTADGIKQEIILFKQGIETKLVTLSSFDEQIGQMGKTTSLIDKRLKEMDQDKISAKEVDKLLNQVRQSLEKTIQNLEKKVEQQSAARVITPVKPLTPLPVPKVPDMPVGKKHLPPLQPEPLLDTDKTGSGPIKEKTLTE